MNRKTIKEELFNALRDLWLNGAQWGCDHKFPDSVRTDTFESFDNYMSEQMKTESWQNYFRREINSFQEQLDEIVLHEVIEEVTDRLKDLQSYLDSYKL